VVESNTLLINIERDWNLFKSWFDGVDFSLKLLFRGSDQEFSNANFQRLVGNQQPTLHIIKSEHDHIFGGCAFEKYPTGSSVDKRDDKAFLFQTHPNQVRLKNRISSYPDHLNYAIRSYNDSLSYFGYNSNLRIYEKNSSKSYTARLGTGTYEKPAGCNN
jgi:hypothetical protein